MLSCLEALQGKLSYHMALLPFWKINSARRKGQAEEATKEKDEVIASSGVSILELPLPILMNIFSRLPIKTILQIKCVCKTLFSLFSDPYFAKIHLARAPLSLLALTNYYHRIYTNSPVPSLTLSQNQIRNKQNLPDQRLSLLTSCNGLICLYEFNYKKDDISVCNPMLGEHLVLPQLERKMVDRRIRGFGFNQSTDQYKVIQTLRYKDQAAISNNLQVEINSIGSDLWRNIGTLPYQLVHPYYGALLNGALHWYVHSPDNETAFLCSFDLRNEQFQPFPGPPIQSFDKCKPMNGISVGVSASFLYLCDGFLEPNVEIWIMNDYGVKESWTKQFVIVNRIVSNLQRVFGSMNILNYRVNMEKKATEAAEQLILFGSQDLIAYNVRSKGVRQLNIFGTNANYQAIAYFPSLVSINKKISSTKSDRSNSISSQSERKFLVHAG